MNPIKTILGTLVRHGLGWLGAIIAARGYGTLSDASQANITEIVVGVIMAISGPVASYLLSRMKFRRLTELEELLCQYGIIPPSKPPPAIKANPLLLVAALIPALFLGCAVMSQFDQNSYDTATGLKSESLALVAKASAPAANHAQEISALKSKLSAQIAYEEGKGKANLISAAQWRVLADPEGNLLGGLVREWEEGKTFSPPYLQEKAWQIGAAFDQILKLEGAKRD